MDWHATNEGSCVFPGLFPAYTTNVLITEVSFFEIFALQTGFFKFSRISCKEIGS